MTLATNAMSTFIAKGNREDLDDEIYRIDPTDTPFVSGVDKINASHTLHGGTQEAMNPAGRSNEFSYQMMLKGLELRRDMELALVGTNSAKVAGNSLTARQTATVESWILTNVDKASDGGNPAAADGTGTRTDGTQRAFLESQLKTVLASAWTNGGKPDTILVGSFNKQAFSTFTGRSTPMEEAASKKIVAAVTTYESDFGTVKVVADRFSRSRNALVLQMDLWAIAYLRNMKQIPLAKTGDRDLAAIIVEYGLEARNEKGSGIVADLTVS